MEWFVVTDSRWDRRTRCRSRTGVATLNATDGDSDLWSQLGRDVRRRRLQLQLTQSELGALANVAAQTVHRIEAGRQTKRYTSSWSKLEGPLGWPRGYIEDFLAGKVLGPPEPADGEGRFTRQRKDDETDIVRDLVRMITLEVAPGTPLSKVLELEKQAIEFARSRGFQGPPEAPSTSDDVYDGT